MPSACFALLFRNKKKKTKRSVACKALPSLRETEKPANLEQWVLFNTIHFHDRTKSPIDKRLATNYLYNGYRGLRVKVNQPALGVTRTGFENRSELLSFLSRAPETFFASLWGGVLKEDGQTVRTLLGRGARNKEYHLLWENK